MTLTALTMLKKHLPASFYPPCGAMAIDPALMSSAAEDASICVTASQQVFLQIMLQELLVAKPQYLGVHDGVTRCFAFLTARRHLHVCLAIKTTCVCTNRCSHKQQWGGLGTAAFCTLGLPLGHCRSGPGQEGQEAGSTRHGLCDGARAGLVDLRHLSHGCFRCSGTAQMLLLISGGMCFSLTWHVGCGFVPSMVASSECCQQVFGIQAGMRGVSFSQARSCVRNTTETPCLRCYNSPKYCSKPLVVIQLPERKFSPCCCNHHSSGCNMCKSAVHHSYATAVAQLHGRVPNHCLHLVLATRASPCIPPQNGVISAGTGAEPDNLK